MAVDKQQIEYLVKNPAIARKLFDKYDAEERLLNFIKLGWSVLEPGRKFVTGWHIEAVCEHLEAITHGEIKRLVINVPPGCMKSLTTNVFWPAWEWGPRDMPTTRYVSASYSQDLTTRDNKRCRNLMNSDIYQEHWGHIFGFAGDQNAKTRYDNSKTGFKIATSVNGMGTGERGDRFIIDDPNNIKDVESEVTRESTNQWFTEVVPTRLNEPAKSAILVIMQRTHYADVSGLILARQLGYDHLNLPMEYERGRKCFIRVPMNYMGPIEKQKTQTVGYSKSLTSWIPAGEMNPDEVEHDTRFEEMYPGDPREKEGELMWPEHMPEETIEGNKEVLGSYAYNGQFQQRPVPRGGGLFNKADFNVIETCPSGGRVVRGWDIAATQSESAAWTAGLKMRLMPNNDIIIEHVTRFRENPSSVERRIKNVIMQDGLLVRQSFPQDPAAAGKIVVTSWSKSFAGYDVHFSLESGDKEFRAIPISAQVEAGNVYIVRGPWNYDFLEEVSTFPRGLSKDQVDAMSRAYGDLLGEGTAMVASTPPEMIEVEEHDQSSDGYSVH